MPNLQQREHGKKTGAKGCAQENQKMTLEAYESARGAGDGWIACSERMPEPGDTENSWVLAWSIGGYGKGRVRLLNWCHSGEPHWRNEQDDRMWATVTHWRPLPPPPTDKAREG